MTSWTYRYDISQNSPDTGSTHLGVCFQHHHRISVNFSSSCIVFQRDNGHQMTHEAPRLRHIVPLLFVMASPLAAETVDVKYWGSADLQSYQCADTESSFVHRICYDGQEQHLVVLLRNTYYAYCNVDEPTFDEWLSTPSKGRFYNQRIRSNAVDGLFSCQ